MWFIKYFTFTISILSFFTANSTEYDAVIKYNIEHVNFKFEKKNGMYYFHKTTNIKRRVKINSEYGINQFETLYIPTYEDLNFEYKLDTLSARTIKNDGNILDVNADKIKETTLPANIPFLYGYDGKVNQLAFENLAIGDEIEYEYTVTYKSSIHHDYLWHYDNIIISDEFPIEKAIYTFETDDDITIKFFKFYFNNEIQKEDNTYKLTLNNIKPYKQEFRSIKNKDRHILEYNITNQNENIYTNWNSYFKDHISRSKRKEYFFGGLKISDIEYNINISSFKNSLEKIEHIRNLMNETYKNDAFGVFSTYVSYYMDMYDVSQIFKIFRILHINGSVIFVKNKDTGEINEKCININQFDDIILEVLNEKGESVYWSIFTPFSKFNDIPYEFQKTKGLKVKREDLNYTTSIIELPGNRL